MDFSKLTSNERLGAVASGVVVVAGLIAVLTWGAYAVAWLAIIAALGMLFVIFQPQIAANTNLPGSKGSLMLLTGGIAAVVMVLGFLVSITFIFTLFGFADILYLATVVAALLMGWAGWQEFQAEGGKFQLGSSAPSAPSGAGAPPPAATTAGTDASAPQATEATPPPPATTTPPGAATTPPPAAVPPPPSATPPATPPPASTTDETEREA